MTSRRSHTFSCPANSLNIGGRREMSKGVSGASSVLLTKLSATPGFKSGWGRFAIESATRSNTGRRLLSVVSGLFGQAPLWNPPAGGIAASGRARPRRGLRRPVLRRCTRRPPFPPGLHGGHRLGAIMSRSEMASCISSSSPWPLVSPRIVVAAVQFVKCPLPVLIGVNFPPVDQSDLPGPLSHRLPGKDA